MSQIGGDQTSKRWKGCVGPLVSFALKLNLGEAISTSFIGKTRSTGRRVAPRVAYCESPTAAGLSGRGISEPLCMPGSNSPFLSSPNASASAGERCAMFPLDNLGTDCMSESSPTSTGLHPEPCVLEIKGGKRRMFSVKTAPQFSQQSRRGK